MSDIAKVYASGKEPFFVVGTAAARAAGAGEPEQSGHEKEGVANANLAKVTDITR